MFDFIENEDYKVNFFEFFFLINIVNKNDKYRKQLCVRSIILYSKLS